MYLRNYSIQAPLVESTPEKVQPTSTAPLVHRYISTHVASVNHD